MIDQFNGLKCKMSIGYMSVLDREGKFIGIYRFEAKQTNKSVNQSQINERNTLCLEIRIKIPNDQIERMHGIKAVSG